jgi:hypothetical protein
MKTYYSIECSLIVEAADDDIAREIVYDVCNAYGIDGTIKYVQIYNNKQGDSND